MPNAQRTICINPKVSAMLDQLFLIAFFALAVGLFVFIIRLNSRVLWHVYGRLPTFDQYRSRHPNLVRHGRCRCRSCGGDRIHVHSLDAFMRRHVCTNCGELLYRS